jgi:hypothetical protein
MNGEQTPRRTSYLISLKAQQEEILSKTVMMIEQYAFQFFEIFDLSDYQKYIGDKVSDIKKNKELSLSPYSFYRNLAKKLTKKKDTFMKFIWTELDCKKKANLHLNVKNGKMIRK